MKTPLFCLAGAGPSTSAARYAALAGPTWFSSAGDCAMPMPIAGSLSNLEANFPAALTTGSYALAVVLNGSASSLAASITSASLRASDTSHSVAVVAGDMVQLSCTPSGAPAAQSVVQIGMLLTGSVAGESAIFGGSDSTVNGTKYYSFGSVRVSGNENSARVPFPVPGMIDQLYLKPSVAPGVGKSWTATVYKNGTATGLTIASTGASAAVVSDTNSAHAVTVSPGDLISVEIAASGSPATASLMFSARFTPAIDGMSPVFTSFSTVPTAAATRFAPINGIIGNEATEANALNIVPYACQLVCPHEFLASAPGTSQSRTLTLRSASADTALVLTLDGTSAVKGNFSLVHEAMAGDLVGLKITSSASPASTARMSAGLCAYIAGPEPTVRFYDFAILDRPAELIVADSVSIYDAIQDDGYFPTTIGGPNGQNMDGQKNCFWPVCSGVIQYVQALDAIADAGDADELAIAEAALAQAHLYISKGLLACEMGMALQGADGSFPLERNGEDSNQHFMHHKVIFFKAVTRALAMLSAAAISDYDARVDALLDRVLLTATWLADQYYDEDSDLYKFFKNTNNSNQLCTAASAILEAGFVLDRASLMAFAAGLYQDEIFAVSPVTTNDRHFEADGVIAEKPTPSNSHFDSGYQTVSLERIADAIMSLGSGAYRATLLTNLDTAFDRWLTMVNTSTGIIDTSTNTRTEENADPVPGTDPKGFDVDIIPLRMEEFYWLLGGTVPSSAAAAVQEVGQAFGHIEHTLSVDPAQVLLVSGPSRQAFADSQILAGRMVAETEDYRVWTLAHADGSLAEAGEWNLGLSLSSADGVDGALGIALPGAVVDLGIDAGVEEGILYYLGGGKGKLSHEVAFVYEDVAGGGAGIPGYPLPVAIGIGGNRVRVLRPGAPSEFDVSNG